MIDLDQIAFIAESKEEMDDKTEALVCNIVLTNGTTLCVLDPNRTLLETVMNYRKLGFVPTGVNDGV